MQKKRRKAQSQGFVGGAHSADRFQILEQINSFLEELSQCNCLLKIATNITNKNKIK